MKRYHLVIPAQLWIDVNDAAPEGEPFVSEVKRALKLWRMVRRGEVEVTKDGVKMEVL